MSPLVEQRLRDRAERHGIRFDDPNTPFVIVPEMKDWKETDWQQACKQFYAAWWNNARIRYEQEERQTRIDRLCDITGDVDMARDIADGGIEAFHAWAPRMSLEQFQRVVTYWSTPSAG